MVKAVRTLSREQWKECLYVDSKSLDGRLLASCTVTAGVLMRAESISDGVKNGN